MFITLSGKKSRNDVLNERKSAREVKHIAATRTGENQCVVATVHF